MDDRHLALIRGAGHHNNKYMVPAINHYFDV